MTLHITKEHNNPLFMRKEVFVSITSEKAPSREEVARLLSEKFSSSPEKVKVKTIKGKFGSKKFDVEANIYSSEHEKTVVELKRKKEGAVKAAAK